MNTKSKIDTTLIPLCVTIQKQLREEEKRNTNTSYKKHLVGKHVIKRKHAKVNDTAVFHKETTNQHADI